MKSRQLLSELKRRVGYAIWSLSVKLHLDKRANGPCRSVNPVFTRLVGLFTHTE